MVGDLVGKKVCTPLYMYQSNKIAFHKKLSQKSALARKRFFHMIEGDVKDGTFIYP